MIKVVFIIAALLSISRANAQMTNLCALAKNPQHYTGKMIHVRGTSGGSEHTVILVDGDCSSPLAIRPPEEGDHTNFILNKDADWEKFSDSLKLHTCSGSIARPPFAGFPDCYRTTATFYGLFRYKRGSQMYGSKWILILESVKDVSVQPVILTH